MKQFVVSLLQLILLAIFFLSLQGWFGASIWIMIAKLSGTTNNYNSYYYLDSQLHNLNITDGSILVAYNGTLHPVIAGTGMNGIHIISTDSVFDVYAEQDISRRGSPIFQGQILQNGNSEIQLQDINGGSYMTYRQFLVDMSKSQIKEPLFTINSPAQDHTHYIDIKCVIDTQGHTILSQTYLVSNTSGSFTQLTMQQNSASTQATFLALSIESNTNQTYTIYGLSAIANIPVMARWGSYLHIIAT